MCLRKPLKKIAEFENDFHNMINDIDNDTVVLFEDESYIRDYQALCATWCLKGKQRKIKTYGQHKGVGLFGVLDYINGNIIVEAAEQLNAQSFQDFLEHKVLPAFKNKKIIMILDNGKIHHAKCLAEFKELHKDQLIFMFLPPYAPAINRIEGLWKWLKHNAIHNRFLKGINEIRDAVHCFISAIRLKRNIIRKRLCW